MKQPEEDWFQQELSKDKDSKEEMTIRPRIRPKLVMAKPALILY